MHTLEPTSVGSVTSPSSVEIPRKKMFKPTPGSTGVVGISVTSFPHTEGSHDNTHTTSVSAVIVAISPSLADPWVATNSLLNDLKL